MVMFSATVSYGQGTLKMLLTGMMLFVGLVIVMMVVLLRRPESGWQHKSLAQQHQANPQHRDSVHNNLYSAAQLKLDKIIGLQPKNYLLNL